jgi:Domain of unknown function (DUF4062)
MSGDPPLKYCQDMVKDVDIFICIVGPQYGSRPPEPDDDRSFTEHEYDAAIKANIPCFVAVLPEIAPQEERDRKGLELFIKKVKGNSLVLEHRELAIEELPNDYSKMALNFSTAFHNWRIGDIRSKAEASAPVAILCYELTAFHEASLSQAELGSIHDWIQAALEITKTDHAARRGKFCRIVVEPRGKGGAAANYKQAVVSLARLARQAIGVFPWRQCGVRFATGCGHVQRLEFEERGGASVIDYDGPVIDAILNRLTELPGGAIAVLGDDSAPFTALESVGFHSLDGGHAIADDLEVIGQSPDDGEEKRPVRWEYQHHWVPDERSIPIGDKIIRQLATPLLAASKAWELNYHRPPTNYSAVREALLDPDGGLVILVGPPGMGKSLCALRLVAELMQKDSRKPLMPRIAKDVWSSLNRMLDDRHVLFLDDAFGKSFVRRPDELEAARAELRKYLGLDVADHGKGRVHGQRPVVVITVRTDIWNSVCQRWADKNLKKALNGRVFPFPATPYAPSDYVKMFRAMFYNLDKKEIGEGRKPVDFSPIVEGFSNPMNLRDFFDEVRRTGYFLTKKNLSNIDKVFLVHNRKPKERYRDELINSDYGEFCYFFFVHVFADDRLSYKSLIDFYHDLIGARSRRFDLPWKEVCRAKGRWGEWIEATEQFIASHPLREEALQEYFSGAEAKDKLGQLFQALKELCWNSPADTTVWQAAAFAVPQIGHTLSSDQNELLTAIVASRGGRAARVALANALSDRLRAYYDQLGRIREKPGQLGDKEERHQVEDERFSLTEETLAIFTDALRELLKSDDAAGAAGAAVCDSYRSGRRKTLGPPLVEDVVAKVTGNISDTADVAANLAMRDFKSEVAWAIAANFYDLPSALQDLLEVLWNDKDEWVRLRAGEAVFDYYDPLVGRETIYAAKVKAYIARIPRDESVVVRRGLAAALAEVDLEDEDGTDSRPFAKVLLELAENALTDLDTTEWVIWTFEEQLEPMLRLREQETLRAFSQWALHPNVRVRKWTADVLSGKLHDLDPKSPTTIRLAQLLAGLANDTNEHVCNAAANYQAASWIN